MREWNPVEQRFLLAHEDWLRFARDRAARLLYWRADEDDSQMVALYLQARREGSCTVIPFNHRFYSRERWLSQNTQALIDFYEERREGAQQRGISSDWQPPTLTQSDPVARFYAVADSLMQHHPDIFPGLIFVLQPTRYDAPEQFTAALTQLLTHPFMATPQGSRIRFIVPESEITPALTDLERRYPNLVWVITGRYQMRRLAGEIVADSSERGASGEFRRLFVLLGDTLRNDDITRMTHIRQQMLDIAHEQGWPAQAAVVCLSAGAARLKSGQIAPAQAEYREALHYARQAREANCPGAAKLTVNALFGEASVLLKNNALFKAAVCYQVAAEQAQQDGDGILAVEGWRMRAWCLDKTGHRDMALESAMNGLDAGLLMDTDMRANCGLPLLVQWLAQRLGVSSLRRKAFNQKLEQLFGENSAQRTGLLAAMAVRED